MDDRAVSDEDYQSLWKLHVDTLGAYVGATWGWDDADQRLRFEASWPRWKTGTVLLEGGAIAVYRRTEEHADHVELCSIEIAPLWQNRGVGSQLVLRLISEAATRDKPVRLRVLKVNPRAARFYVRLGFTQIGTGSTHLVLSSRARNSKLSLGSP